MLFFMLVDNNPIKGGVNSTIIASDSRMFPGSNLLLISQIASQFIQVLYCAWRPLWQTAICKMWRSYLVVPCHTVWSKTTPSGVTAFNVLCIWIKTRQCPIGSIVHQCSSTSQSIQLVRSISHHFTNYVHWVPRQGCKKACGIRVITHSKCSEGITDPSQEMRNLRTTTTACTVLRTVPTNSMVFLPRFMITQGM